MFNLEKFFTLYPEYFFADFKSPFWQFFAALTARIVQENLPPLGPEKIILDAGGGAGEWSCFLSEFFAAQFIIYDSSLEAIKKARLKIKEKGKQKRIKAIRGDLREIKEIETESIDCLLSLYNPLSFVFPKEKALQEMFRVLKPQSLALIMVHNFANALSFKAGIFFSGTEDILNLEKEKKGRWAKDSSLLQFFTAADLKADLEKTGWQVEKIYGLPIFLKPEKNDFLFGPARQGKPLSRVSQLLSQKDFFQAMFSLENKYNSQLAYREQGVSLLAIAKKV